MTKKISTTGNTILLPPSGTIPAGYEFEIENNGDQPITIRDGGKTEILKPRHKKTVPIKRGI